MKVKKRKKRIEPKKTKKKVEKKPQGIKKEIDKKVEEVTEKSKAYRTAEFNAFVLWKTLPASLKKLGDGELELMGLKDPMTIKLLDISTQGEFAKEYEIREATLSHWNKIIYKQDLIFNSIGIWGKSMTPNIMMALAKTALSKGEAKEVLAWVKIVENWSDKSQVELGASEELTKALKKVNSIIPD